MRSRLFNQLELLEEKHTKSGRVESTTPNNDNHRDHGDHKEKIVDSSKCKTLSSALDDVQHKGTLIDRLAILENRVLKVLRHFEFDHLLP